MNYYEKHIGDYIRDTVSLTMLEDGAYGRLLDQLYQSERSLPKDKKEIYRLARAISPLERKAVDYVLDKFFTLADDGYTQKRARAVIEAYWDREPAAESKRESAKIRQQRTRDRRKALFEQLRALGVTPEFNASMRHLEAELSRVTNENSHASHKPVTRDNTLTQAPSTNPQSPVLKTSDSDDSTVYDQDAGPPAAPLPTREAPPISNDPAIQLSVALRRQGIKVTFTHPAVQDWAAKGVTVEMLTEAVASARVSKPDGNLPANYLVPIVNELLNPPAAKPGGRPAPVECEWEKTSQGIDAMADKYGVTPRRNEQYRDLARRIKAIIAKGKGPQP